MSFCRSCGAKIDDPAPKCPKCGASQENPAQRKWLVWALAVLVGGVVVGIGIPAYKDYQRRAQEAAAVKEEEDAQLAENRKTLQKGVLKIWVPSGWVGDDFWIYLNGHIANAPPHGGTEPIQVRASGPGEALRWLDFGKGEHLAIDDGDFTNLRGYIDRNINPASGDVQHLFYPVDLELHSGEYTVEVAYLSKKVIHSFPFVITRKYIANVQTGERTQIFAGVPNDWDDHEALQLIRAACPPLGGKPYVSDATEDMNRYLNDPVVQTLRALNASLLSRSKGIVVLNLPLGQGGGREFDVNQIKHIANAILRIYYEPSHEDIADCKQRNPDFSESFDEYDKIVREFENQLQYFHALAGK